MPQFRRVARLAGPVEGDGRALTRPAASGIEGTDSVTRISACWKCCSTGPLPVNTICPSVDLNPSFDHHCRGPSGSRKAWSPGLRVSRTGACDRHPYHPGKDLIVPASGNMQDR